MQSAIDKGYTIWRHAILEKNRYAASGTITSKSKVIEATGVLGYFTTEERAQTAGLEWAKAWIDVHHGS